MFGKDGNHSDDTITPVVDGSDSSSQQWQHPGTPIDNTPVAPTSVVPETVTPSSEATTPATEGGSEAITEAVTNTVSETLTPSTPHDDLVTIKQQALSQLSPLVSHLDQTPEEKFRTTMMMIQATDDQSLIQRAYEAAGQISDEKTRAQALLDIVNEINYFTSSHSAA